MRIIHTSMEVSKLLICFCIIGLHILNLKNTFIYVNMFLWNKMHFEFEFVYVFRTTGRNFDRIDTRIFGADPSIYIFKCNTTQNWNLY